MKHIKALTVCVAFVLILQSQAAEPQELVTARASYRKQVDAALSPINKRYLDYLEQLKKEVGARGDVQGALAVQEEIDQIMRMHPANVPTGGDVLLITNQNNGGKGDRGTKRIHVSLLAAGKVIWSRKSVKIDWDASKVGKLEIPLPTMNAEQVRIEVVDAVNGKGGLGEIAYMREGRNLAQGADVKVSAHWENNPKHAGSMLTDGSDATYWLLPDNLEGWAEITLKR